MELSNKTVLITGAARGIGQALAVACAREGAHVLGVDLTVGALDATRRRVESLGRRFNGFACDVANPDGVQRLIEDAERVGGFDVLVNNAGVAPSGPFAPRAFDEWARTLQVNLVGLMRLTHAALPHLRSRYRAHVVNIASLSGKVGSPGLVAYAASKHGVVGFSAALGAELAFEGASVGVSCICPTMTTTRMIEGVRRSPLIPVASPEDVAAATVDAIRTNTPLVYVPERMRWLVEVLPALAPGVARWLAVHDATAEGWMDARKELPPPPAADLSALAADTRADADATGRGA